MRGSLQGFLVFFLVVVLILLAVAFVINLFLSMYNAPKGFNSLELMGYERCNPYCERIGWEYFRHEVTKDGEECWCHKGEEIKRVV